MATTTNTTQGTADMTLIEMPAAGENAVVTLSDNAEIAINATSADIQNVTVTPEGALVVSFTQGQTVTIENFQQGAANGQTNSIPLADGTSLTLNGLAVEDTAAVNLTAVETIEMMNPAVAGELANLIAKPDQATGATTYELQSGEAYVANFSANDVRYVERLTNGDIIISFKDGSQTTLHMVGAETAETVPAMTLADGTVITITDLLSAEFAVLTQDPVEQMAEIDMIEIAQTQPLAGDLAAQLAAIEPAAGDAAGAAAGPLSGSNNFGSSVLPIGLDPALAVGPIGATELAFDIPEVDNLPLFIDVEEPAPILGTNQARGYEDTGINFGVTASPSVSGQFITVTVSGIPAGWTPDNTDATTARGTYDAAAGTWTITLAPNESLPASPVFVPPLNSDADIDQVNVVVNQFDPATGNTGTGTTTGSFSVLVDAVADDINLNANDVAGQEDTAVDLDISTSLRDIDGSEEITNIVISGLPDGFSLNQGTQLSTGTWAVTQAQLNDLKLSAPANYNGTVTLTVTVVNEEVNFSDSEFDLTNNINQTSTDFDVTFKGVADKPDLMVNAPTVKEDGTTELEIKASLKDTDGSENLVITVTGIDAGWTVETGANNGTYNAATGTWTITLPAGQNYDGSLKLTPPADSDVDMDNIVVTADAVERNGSTATTTVTTNVVVDAVIDTPTLDGQDINGESGKTYDLNIQNTVGDTDGSETLGAVTISGVPAGFSLSAGNQVSPGVWEVQQNQLSGLKLNTPTDYEGSFQLNLKVTATDNPTDEEFDLSDNEMTVNDTITVNLEFNDLPPEVTFGGANGAGEGEARVYEDGTVFAPITANLNGTSPQQLTVTVTGIDSSWTVVTGANNGTYNAATGTWTITLPAGQNYNGGLTFTPPADSDIDMSDLEITATATNTQTNETKSATTDGEVIVDAVADKPNLNAGADQTVEAGESVDLNIATSLNDTDGSETLGNVTISGLPNGYSLNKGTEVSQGVWEVARNDLNGLKLNTPLNGQGNVELTVSVTATEQVSDEDFDLTNNQATTTDKVVIHVNADDKPVLADDDKVSVDESDLNPTDTGSSTITANFGNDTPGTYIVTGENTFSFTGAENGQLTSNGVPVVVTVEGNGYVGTAGGEEIFRLELNENTGNYDFTLSGTLDHADETNPDDVIELTFGVTAKDSDGDTDAGFIKVDVKDDAPVAHDDVNASECEIVTQDKDYNVALILDISGSMQGNKLALLKSSVTNLLNDFGDYENGQIKVHITPFYTVASESQVFTVSNEAELQAAINFVNGLQASGGTNYEAPMQQAIDWLQGNTSNDPISGAETYTYFVSDGNPTRYQNDKGQSILVGEENADVVMGEISGTDGTNEIQMLKNLSKEVIGVGIGLTPDALARLDQIDSDGDAMDVQDPNDLDAAFQSTNPVSGRATGNVITGENGGANAADDLSQDADNKVTAIIYDGKRVVVDATNGATIQADHGTLKINANGSYTFVVTGRDNNGGFSEKFTYVLTDGDGDSSSANLTISCTPKPVDMPPEVSFGGDGGAGQGEARVYEDGTVFVPIAGGLTGSTSQQLTVTLTGIDASWKVETGANNGTYNAATGTWTITLPAGQNYDGGLTFTPPANSDVDLDGLTVTATAKNTETGAVKTASTDGEIIVDAVADKPDLNAGADQSVISGNSVALNISTGLKDTDGSETLSNVKISGVPTGYTLNKGSQVSNGVWEVSRSDLNGLKLNTPANGNGKVELTVSVTSTEKVTDGEFNLNNNTATATDKVVFTVNPGSEPPAVGFGANGSGHAQVLEDGSVFVPITASLKGQSNQQLTVTLTGVDADWKITTGANNGTYNAATGTWTITLPKNTNYNGGLTFAPPADSDVDMTGLKLTATSKNLDKNGSEVSSTTGKIIVDAVADMPDLDAGADKTVDAGNSIALNISTKLNDTDGSETLGNVKISGIPNGYSLSKGTQVSNGVWEVSRSDLSGLKLNTPANGNGKINLTVSVTATEKVTDGEFIQNNNQATATDKIVITVNGDDHPVIGDLTSPISLEEKLTTPNVINGKIVADFGQDGNGASFGIPGNGKFSANGAVGGSTLTSGGVKVNVVVDGNTYYGKAGGKIVFELTVNKDGSYKFIQTGFLDHKSATNPNEIINLNFDVFAKDGDGDLDVATLTVRVKDTGPVAKDDAVIMYSCDYATIGNVITSYNQSNNGKDVLSVEGPNKVQSVTFEGKTYAIPQDGGEGVMVNGDHGSLFMFANGSYSYVSFEDYPKASHNETFSYTLVDGDGDVSKANLNIRVQEVEETRSQVVEYEPFRGETNARFEGQDAWKTSNNNGAILMGGNDNDVLLGGNGDDLIFGWRGNDTLVGGNGNDVLQGEHGSNTLIGGNGADIFSIHPDKAGSNVNVDTIRDFTPDEGDVLDLHDIITGFDAKTDDIADFVRIVNTTGGKMVQVNSDGQGNDFYNAVKIENHADLDLKMLDVYDMYAKGHLDVA